MKAPSIVAHPFETVIKDVSAGNQKVQKGAYLKSGQFPVIDQGKAFIGGYTNDGSALVAGDGPWIVFGDHTRSLKYVDFPFCMGADGVKVLRPTDGRRIHAKYVYHYLLATEIPSAGYSRHFKFLKRLEIPLPPLDEQRRIAAILDKADALRRKRKRALDLLDGLAQAAFLELFGDLAANSKGWNERRPLASLADIASGITKGRKLNGTSTRSVPYLAVANVQDKRLDLSTVKTIEASEEEVRRYRLETEDLLLTEGGDPDKLGRGTLWRGEIVEAIHQNHIFRVRATSKEVTPTYLIWLIGSPYGKSYFLRSAKQTTGIASINKRQLSDFPVVVPPIGLQEKFTEAVRSIGGVAEGSASALREVEALFSSLQHRAFAGQL